MTFNYLEDNFTIGDCSINPWLIGNIGPKHTGVDAMLWVSSQQLDLPPLILVGLDAAKNSSINIVVSVENTPKIIAPDNVEISAPLWKKITEWIKLNKEALMRHWNDEIDTAELLCEQIKRI